MTLCVFEDKLSRMMHIQDKYPLMAELECVREWDPFEHPRWLAFEVEQELQIRPYQFSVVQQLLENPGAVTQLNMGLGKTRVLLPMLLLELAQSSDSIVRVNALPSIIDEAINYYRSILVASVQHLRVFSLPFNRNNALDQVCSRILSQEMTRCRDHFGCLIVTPQDRNSLLLKQYEYGVKVAALEESFTDVLDESDAILDHNFQLVYAIGIQTRLPDGRRRWKIIMLFLKTLTKGDNSEEISHLTSDSRLVHQESRRLGSFPKFRFLSSLKSHETKLGPALCRRLIIEAPHDFRWMKQVSEEKTTLLVRIMSDPHYKHSIKDVQSDPLFDEFKSDILAARGCIAYGLLFHGLYLRYRVDYGLHTDPDKKMAVPYAASDTAKTRAEYSHPDMAILYTCLSYYHEGLHIVQFKEAVVRLQSLGPIHQEMLYGEWVESVRYDAFPSDLASFDAIGKVDVDNRLQLEVMHKELHRSMDVISFWMDHFVFPDSTHQFPARRVTSAWNLVDTGRAIGFSGTDDNRFLLPLQVKQISAIDSRVRATNGAMIDCILRCTQGIYVLDDGDEDCPLWRVVLRQCESLGVSALIDVAGLMAGSDNREVAHSAADRVSRGRVLGVVYFDAKQKAWAVYEIENKRDLLLQISSLTAAECFVYFDQSRCRESDMKLRKDASALVTLEPTLPKDKFMQGCARMRNLRPGGQSLILAGTSEVVKVETTTEEVLERILQNTVDLAKKGLVSYYERGKNYFSFPTEILVDVSLATMYSRHTNEHDDFCTFLEATHVVESSPRDPDLLQEYCKEIGQGVQTEVLQLSEECEQEREREVECEEEQQVELAVQQPYAEREWGSFAQAFTDPESLFKSGLFVSLQSLIDEHVPALSAVAWSSRVFCTLNFWTTIQRVDQCKNYFKYLRPVNAMLRLPDGRVVLISEYETDKLLTHWWGKIGEPKAILHHLCMAVHETAFGKDAGTCIPVKIQTTVKLFRGHVQFSLREKRALAIMFQSTPHARQLIENFLFIRSRTRFFERSDLDVFASSNLQVPNDGR